MDIFICSPIDPAFNEVASAVRREAQKRGLSCCRVDQDYIDKATEQTINVEQTINQEIRSSRFVVADITDNHPNVLHEIGQAYSLGKPIIIISQNPRSSAPFNIRGFPIIRYDRNNLKELRKKLGAAFLKATSDNETLRAMLAPPSLGPPTQTSWFVIAASPLSYRRAIGRSGGYKKIRRTYSDYTGIRGILQGFGSLYGFATLPDLIDPEDYDDCAIEERMSLYCIASPKANRWTSLLLKEYQKRYVPRIEFKADSASPDLRNIQISIFSDGSELKPPGFRPNPDLDRKGWDFGLIMRGPNPFSHHDQMVAILAGRSSLGTEAACRAFTDVACIKEIRKRLAAINVELEDHKQPFWCLVSLKKAVGTETEAVIPETLRVHDVAPLQRTE